MKKIIDLIKKLLGSKPTDSNSKGFTLIELLVVIAVIGVLAAAVLIAIDPVQQLARGRDAGRKQAISQMGRAVQTNYTAVGTLIPQGGATNWATTLVNSGDLKLIPANGTGVTLCTGAGGGDAATGNGTICYEVAGAEFIVYQRLESKVERNKGTCGNVALNTWYVYSSFAGKAGTWCGTDPTPPIGAGLLL